MHLDKTALLLVGLQNDHFGLHTPLREMMDDPGRIEVVKNRILDLMDHLEGHSSEIVNLPIHFQDGHPEITQSVGILAAIKQCNLFVENSYGGDTIPELSNWESSITTLRGRTGFNGFVNTGLHEYLQDRGIQQIVLAGSCTSICIDSTARSGYELGYDVVILDDCTISRTTYEQEMYCQSVFPLYSDVMNSTAFMSCHGLEYATDRTRLAG